MNILVSIERDATQAKLILNTADTAVIKIPGYLSLEQQNELRDKLIKVADMNKDNKQFLKLYYKIGTPYLFLNRKVSGNKRETFAIYKYADL